MPWTELMHSHMEYMNLSMDRGRGLVRMRRSDRAITKDIIDSVVGRFVQEAERLMPAAERRGFRLLVDSREAPRAADPALEAKLSGTMTPLMLSFGCVAVLLKTPIGILQMRRLLRGWPVLSEVFEDEAEALLWLLRQEIGKH